MPLGVEDRDKIISYCDRDLPNQESIEKMFSFIEDENLNKRLVSEYVAARYIYKLSEALKVDGEKLAAHAKFQIVQYASIYEAIIVHVLWNYYPESPEVSSIEYYSSLSKASKMPSDILIRTKEDEEIFLCTEKKRKNTIHSIKFDDKVDAAISIGFLDKVIGQDIKEFYRLRNGIHLQNAVKNLITYELEQSQLAYLRMLPFTRGVDSFLKTNTLPKNARAKNARVKKVENARASDPAIAPPM